MKISIAISTLILAIAAGLGWRDHQQLVTLRESHATLVAEAAALGLSVDAENPDDGGRITKRQRENKAAEARLAAAEFIDFAKEMEALESAGEEPDEAAMERIMNFMERIISLDASQLKILIAEVRTSTELKDETRDGLIGFSIMTLATEHPQSALAIFTESADLFDEQSLGQQVVASALSSWAAEDAMGALAWVRENGKNFPDLVNNDVKAGMISGVASKDPMLALQLISDLGIKDTDNAIMEIAQTPLTNEERIATLEAIRAHIATVQDESAKADLLSGAMGSMATGVASQGFETATAWIAEAGLSATEIEQFVGGLSYQNLHHNEVGQWIEWAGETLPADQAKAQIGPLMQDWTENDYQAAGTWLAKAPAGPTKEAGISAYAVAVSHYEPETAAQWALTLPPGKERDQTLRQIYQNWPTTDSAGKEAAEAFKVEHGIKGFREP